MSFVVNKKTVSGYVVIAVAAVTFALFFSVTTSPLYEYGAYCDSAMFQVIGRGWCDGVLPYVGLWDSKGPMIFFINALGYAMTGTQLGVFILQVLFLAVTVSVAFRWLSSVYGFHGALAASLAVLVGLSLVYDFGNLTEEYLLPLLFTAYYLMYKWTVNASKGVYAHLAVHSLVYGMVLGFSLMTRVTNAIGVCVGVLFVLCFLVRHGLWKNILHNFLWFAAGFALMVLPFLVYFGVHGILDEMWYGTFGYNVSYSIHSAGHYVPMSFVYASRNYFYCILAIAAGAVAMFCGNRLKGAFWLSSALVTFVFLNFTYRIPHYGMVALPYLCATFVLSRDCMSAVMPSVAKLFNAVSVSAVSASLLYMAVFKYGSSFDNGHKHLMPMVSVIPACERDSFIGYNCDAGIYVWTGMMPACRYFSFQDWAVGNDERLTGKLVGEYAKCRVKWILFDGDAYDTEIGGIVRSRYRLVKEDRLHGYSLYRLNEPCSGGKEGVR